MTQTLKVLGQIAPSATTETDLYTVPASTTVTVSTIHVVNRGGSAGSFRISIAVNGGATGNKDYIYYDEPIAANSGFPITTGITLNATDKIKVYASSANFSFSVFGVEVT